MNTRDILPIVLDELLEFYEIDPSVYCVVDNTKTDIEASISRHNSRNILASISWYLYLILNNDNLVEGSYFIIDNLNNSLLKWEPLDFSYLLGFINLYYRGDNLHWDENFKKILKAISILKDKQTSERYSENKIKINFEDIKHSIIENISHFCDLDDYLINFRFFSNLWIDFYLKPVLITLIIDLVHNSVKYSDTWTKIDVTVNQTKEWITVSVADEWFWIKEEDIEKIFEHGKRLDNVGDNNWNGIWWAKLVYEIDKAWWELFVKSKVWVWTEILFRIPDKK